jgi:outer membrane translocation and assembly module TamA
MTSDPIRVLPRKLSSTHIALVISLASLVFTAYSVRSERRESEMQLWVNLRQEFNYSLVKERIACGKAYKDGTLDLEYSRVMDFFETVGFLVQSGRMRDDLFKETWGYYFSGYFQATKGFLQQDRAIDKTSYEGVFYLENHFGPDPTLRTPADLRSFFDDEQHIPNR